MPTLKPLKKPHQTFFKTATHYRGGGRRATPQAFPIPGQRTKPKLFTKPLARRVQSSLSLTPVEKHAIEAEQRLIDHDLKGYTITIKLKTGSIEDIPLIAKSWGEALEIAKKKVQRYDPASVDEIVIVDPDLGEILHKIGSGATKAVSAIGRGAKWLAKKTETGAIKAARVAGRVAAVPAEMRESYRAAKKERPWLTEEEFVEEKVPAKAAPPPPPPEEPPKTIEDWRKATPALYYRGRERAEREAAEKLAAEKYEEAVRAPPAVAAPPAPEMTKMTPTERLRLARETRETFSEEAEHQKILREERLRAAKIASEARLEKFRERRYGLDGKGNVVEVKSRAEEPFGSKKSYITRALESSESR